MSNFICEHCGTECIDTEMGYITGCIHYPADQKKVSQSVEVEILDSITTWLSVKCPVYGGRCSCTRICRGLG
jgi:hypothetical protein